MTAVRSRRCCQLSVTLLLYPSVLLANQCFVMSGKAIFFDLDDTLIDRRATARRYAELLVRDFAHKLLENDLAHIGSIIWQADLGGHSPTREQDLIRRLRWKTPPSETDLADHWRDLFPPMSIARADARDVLMSLRRDGFLVGVVTNGPIARQRLKLRIAGLWEQIDTFMTSEMIGISKPHAGIFTIACERAGVHPDNAVFIGDHPEIDVAAATAAGMAAVWLHVWGDSPPDSSFNPRLRARTLRGAVGMARRLLRDGPRTLSVVTDSSELSPRCILILHSDTDVFYSETLARVVKMAAPDVDVRTLTVNEIVTFTEWVNVGAFLVDSVEALEAARRFHAALPIVIVRRGDSDDRFTAALRHGARLVVDVPRDLDATTAQLLNSLAHLVGTDIMSAATPREDGLIRKTGSVTRTSVGDQVAFLEYVRSTKPYVAEMLPEVRRKWKKRNRIGYEMPLYAIPSLRDIVLYHRGHWSVHALAKTAVDSVIERMFDRVYCENRISDVPTSFLEDAVFRRFTTRQRTTHSLLKYGHLEAPRSLLSAFLTMLRAERITIGGRHCLNPAQILATIGASSKWRELVTPPFLAMVHGDLHFDNILVDDDSAYPPRIILIDPRGNRLGSFPPGTGDIARDIGKLLHSAHGQYDLIHAGCVSLDWTRLRFSSNKRTLSAPALQEQVWITRERKGGASGAEIVVTERAPEAWRRSVCSDLGDVVTNAVSRQREYVEVDPHWLCRARLYEALQFCTVAPFHLKDDVRRAFALHLRGIELFNDYLEAYRHVAG